MKHVDGSLLLLFMGLFVVNAAMAATDMPQHLLTSLRGAGVNLNEPITLFTVAAVISNIVGNNAAVMLLVPYLDVGANRDVLGAALALGTGFSSSLVVFGSLAGIIVVEQAAAHGVKISFWEFSRSGVIAALACMALACAAGLSAAAGLLVGLPAESLQPQEFRDLRCSAREHHEVPRPMPSCMQ